MWRGRFKDRKGKWHEVQSCVWHRRNLANCDRRCATRALPLGNGSSVRPGRRYPGGVGDRLGQYGQREQTTNWFGCGFLGLVSITGLLSTSTSGHLQRTSVATTAQAHRGSCHDRAGMAKMSECRSPPAEKRAFKRSPPAEKRAFKGVTGSHQSCTSTGRMSSVRSLAAVQARPGAPPSVCSTSVGGGAAVRAHHDEAIGQQPSGRVTRCRNRLEHQLQGAVPPGPCLRQNAWWSSSSTSAGS